MACFYCTKNKKINAAYILPDALQRACPSETLDVVIIKKCIFLQSNEFDSVI